MTGNAEQRVFDLLAQRAGVELCEACAGLRQDCDSVRKALQRLVGKGKAGIAHAQHRVAFYFMVRDADRPVDGRDGRAGREARWRK